MSKTISTYGIVSFYMVAYDQVLTEIHQKQKDYIKYNLYAKSLQNYSKTEKSNTIFL